MRVTFSTILMAIAIALTSSCNKSNTNTSAPRTITLSMGIDSEILDFSKKSTTPSTIATLIDTDGYRMTYADNTGSHVVTSDLNIIGGNVVLPDVEGDVTISVFDYSHKITYLANTEEFMVNGVAHDGWFNTYSVKGEIVIPEIAFQGVVSLENEEYIYIEGVNIDGQIDYILVQDLNMSSATAKFLAGDGYLKSGFVKLGDGTNFLVTIVAVSGEAMQATLSDVTANQMFRYTVSVYDGVVDSDVSLEIADAFTGEFVETEVVLE